MGDMVEMPIILHNMLDSCLHNVGFSIQTLFSLCIEQKWKKKDDFNSYFAFFSIEEQIAVPIEKICLNFLNRDVISVFY